MTRGGTGQPLKVPTPSPHLEGPSVPPPNSLRDAGSSPSPAALCSGPRAPPADGLSPSGETGEGQLINQSVMLGV